MRIPFFAHLRVATGALALARALTACDSSADDEVELAKLSDACRINSDCGSLLVCVFERCHEECETSRDCEADSRCVQSPQSRNVCQLPDEQACSERGACPGEQVCGIDGECRDACRSNGECLAEQRCSGGTCADSVELDERGQLEPAPERPPTAFTPCAFDSDCPPREVCASGACRAECHTDAECADTERCVEQSCAPRPAAPSCRRNSDCAANQACDHGQCVELEVEPEPACSLNSDCPAKGQRCRGGECVCECSTTADCAIGRVCQDGCACVGGRVIDGDVRIQNDRELALLRDVVEVTGRLEVQVAGAADYHLPSLRKVGSFATTGNGGIIWLESLEESTGNLQCFRECRLPRLRHAGDLQLSSASFRTIELPQLETVSGSLHVYYSSNLRELQTPKLKSARDLRVHSDVRLTKLELPALESLENLSLGSNEQLQVIALPLAAPSVSVDISNNPALEALSLPSLQSLSSGFSMWGNSILERVELPALERVNELSLQTMPHLSRVDLPTLTEVSSGLAVTSTSGPETLNLPALTSVGTLTLSATNGIRAISAPRLDTMTNLYVNHVDLVSLALPLTTLTGNLAIDTAPQLSSIELAALTTTGQLGLALLPALTQLDLSSLQTSSNITIHGTALTDLSSLYFGAGGALKSVGPLQITSNTALPVCAVHTLTATLATQGWNDSLTAYGNLECECNGAVCQ